MTMRWDPMSENSDEIPLNEEDIYERRPRRPPALNAAYGWSTSGRILVPRIPFGSTTGKLAEDDIGPLQVSFPRPGYHTVQFNILQKTPLITDPVLNPLVVRAKAEIIWSVQGNAVRRVINVTDGSSLSGTGEAVNVDISDDSFFNFITDADYEYEVVCQVTPGVRPNIAGSQPPIKNPDFGYYGVGGAFPANGSFVITNPAEPTLTNLTNILIPQNCGINSYYLSIGLFASVTDPVGNDFVIVQDGGSPGIAQAISSTNYEGGVNKWVPLSPGAKIITIINNFELANPSTIQGTMLFGVDG